MKKIVFVLVALVLAALVVFFVMRKPSPSAPPISPPATSAVQSESAPFPQATTVVIENFAFHPAEMRVKTGDKVVWTNKDGAPHRVEIGDTAKSADLSKGDGFEFVFSKAGEYPYICGIHPRMTGKIIVE